MKKQTFYYKFRTIDTLLLLNLALIYMLYKCCHKIPALLHWPQVQAIIAAVIVSSLIWIYLHCFKHKVAVIDGKNIKIDHCQPLAWKDIDYAEERIVRCCFKKRRIIVLIPKDGIDYQYNYLQKHNGEFTPFSIPLYNIISKKDEEEIIKIISKKVKLTRLK